MTKETRCWKCANELNILPVCSKCYNEVAHFWNWTLKVHPNIIDEYKQTKRSKK